MSGKKIVLAVVVAVIAVGAIFLVLPKKDKSANNSTSSNTTDQHAGHESSNSQDTTKTYTAEEVAKHDKESDCWTIINDNVYDLTSFIPEHPGGGEILRACGIDASTLFNQRETADGEEVGSGTPHSSAARSELAELQIGTLAK